MEKQEPKIYNGRYVEMLIPFVKCASCGKMMFKKDKSNVFCKNRHYKQESQLEIIDGVFESDVPNDKGPICECCKEAGLATFVCDICGQELPTDKIQESFGYPSEEFLCKYCYESVSAKVWEEKCNELQESYKWDNC